VSVYPTGRKFKPRHTAYEGCGLGRLLEKIGRFLDGTNSLLSPYARGGFWKIIRFQVPHFPSAPFSQIAFKAHSAGIVSWSNALDAFEFASMPFRIPGSSTSSSGQCLTCGGVKTDFITADRLPGAKIIEIMRKARLCAWLRGGLHA
jgi:hypothetical protein